MRKRILFGAMALLMLITLNPQTANATTETKQEVSTSTHSEQEVEVLVARIYEINEMDRSAMTSSERKELKNEVRGIKEQLAGSPVLYISGGALILIIILLIILL